MHEAVLIQKKEFGLVVIDVQSGKVVLWIPDCLSYMSKEQNIDYF